MEKDSDVNGLLYNGILYLHYGNVYYMLYKWINVIILRKFDF